MAVSFVIREEAWETSPSPGPEHGARGMTPERGRQDTFLSLDFLSCFCTWSLLSYNKQVFGAFALSIPCAGQNWRYRQGSASRSA